jgi:hypothetical protein
MTAIVVNGSTPFGGMVNGAVGDLVAAGAAIHRANLAQAAAQSGAAEPTAAVLEGGNFGVVPDATPGQQGAAWAYALGVLDDALQTFLTAHQAQITALDNG